MSVVNFALGSGAAAAAAERYLRRYYGAAPFLESMVQQTPTTGEDVRAALDAHRLVGCDEVVLLPCAADRQQLELAAQAL